LVPFPLIMLDTCPSFTRYLRLRVETGPNGLKMDDVIFAGSQFNSQSGPSKYEYDLAWVYW